MSTTATPSPPPAPLIDEDSRRFWEATREGRIALCHCTGCNAWLARPLERCNVCAGPTEFSDVSGRGTVYTFVVVHRPVIPAYAHLVPYIVAIVEFDEGPRLPGIVLDAQTPDIAIGRRVQAELMDVPGTDERAIAYRLTDDRTVTATR